jgi:hypothetical protein
MIEITPLGILILTWQGLFWIAGFCFIVGMAGAWTAPFIGTALDRTKKAKARYAKMIPVEAQRTIDTLYRLNAEGAEREKQKDKKIASLTRLHRERSQYDRYADSRTHAAILGHESE